MVGSLQSNNINTINTSVIESTYKKVHLHMKTKAMNLSLMNVETNWGWDYHIQPNQRLAEPNLSSANHPLAMSQS